MAVNYISIRERIKQVRKRRGLSQNVLAQTIADRWKYQYPRLAGLLDKLKKVGF